MSTTDSPVTAKAQLLDHLQSLGIDAVVVPYPAHTTVEEGKRLRGDMAGTFTKNLLLKDKKGRLFLVCAHEDSDIDLKTLHTRLGARGRLGFASSNTMESLLGVAPGTATPLAIRADTEQQITVVLEASLTGAELLNFHPMVHTESLSLTPTQLQAYLADCNHSPLVVDLTGDRT